MQTPMTAGPSPKHPQPMSARSGAPAPRGERSIEETVRPVVLEPHWAAAIDAATD